LLGVSGWVHPGTLANTPSIKKEIRGKISSPSRSIAQRIILITVSVIFIFGTALLKALPVPDFEKSIKNSEI
jgi:hypothetical protein